MRGHLIWFNDEKCHGFIRTEDGERLLVEESGFEPGTVLGGRCAGTLVTFEREGSGDSVPRAVRASIVPDNRNARRARLRHR
jgi:cold shock CspA family protein